jgi:hypothetical protein
MRSLEKIACGSKSGVVKTGKGREARDKARSPDIAIITLLERAGTL